MVSGLKCEACGLTADLCRCGEGQEPETWPVWTDEFRMELPAVETGRTQSGLRWARSGQYRILAYAEGGWCEQWLNGSVGWCLFSANDAMPWGVRNRLLRALGLRGGA
jgi:hypothetical protein